MSSEQPIPEPAEPVEVQAATRALPAVPKPRAGWLEIEPMVGPVTLSNVTEALLRRPGRLLHTGSHAGVGLSGKLVLVAAVSLAVFGVILGTYSGGVQLWAAPLKLILGMAVASLICFPSLYIFSAMDGLEARPAQLATLLLATIALTALLLLGFAPVVWVFCVSTESLPFIGTLVVIFWLIGLYFGRRILSGAAGALGARSSGFIRLWVVIFTIVALQMGTSLRPLIGTAETFLPTEKRFFLQHWAEQITDEE